MNYLVSEQNILVWFCFTVYVFTAVFLLPDMNEFKSETLNISPQNVVKFAARFICRIVLIFPIMFLLKNAT